MNAARGRRGRARTHLEQAPVRALLACAETCTPDTTRAGRFRRATTSSRHSRRGNGGAVRPFPSAPRRNGWCPPRPNDCAGRLDAAHGQRNRRRAVAQVRLAVRLDLRKSLPVAVGLEARLAKLREGYAARMSEKLDTLDVAVRSVTGQHASAADVERLWGLAHKLAGTAGSYGFAPLGEVVSEMASLLEPFRSHGDPPRPVCDGLALLMAEARRLSQDD